MLFHPFLVSVNAQFRSVGELPLTEKSTDSWILTWVQVARTRPPTKSFKAEFSESWTSRATLGHFLSYCSGMNCDLGKIEVLTLDPWVRLWFQVEVWWSSRHGNHWVLAWRCQQPLKPRRGLEGLLSWLPDFPSSHKAWSRFCESCCVLCYFTHYICFEMTVTSTVEIPRVNNHCLGILLWYAVVSNLKMKIKNVLRDLESSCLMGCAIHPCLVLSVPQPTETPPCPFLPSLLTHALWCP